MSVIGKIVGGNHRQSAVIQEGFWNTKLYLARLEGYSYSKTMELNHGTVKSCGLYNETSKRSTGSTIGRAAAGGLLFGPAGAIVGGLTGKKKSTFYVEIVLNDDSQIILECSKLDKDILLNTLL